MGKGPRFGCPCPPTSAHHGAPGRPNAETAGPVRPLPPRTQHGAPPLIPEGPRRPRVSRVPPGQFGRSLRAPPRGRRSTEPPGRVMPHGAPSGKSESGQRPRPKEKPRMSRSLPPCRMGPADEFIPQLTRPPDGLARVPRNKALRPRSFSRIDALWCRSSSAPEIAFIRRSRAASAASPAPLPSLALFRLTFPPGHALGCPHQFPVGMYIGPAVSIGTRVRAVPATLAKARRGPGSNPVVAAPWNTG